ncbi:MAG TPA: hypothetical protein VK133_02505 [Amoebophilaceae bacterium]|nr:hypothetical protein [Amoebophilaceae bacterium]
MVFRTNGTPNCCKKTKGHWYSMVLFAYEEDKLFPFTSLLCKLPVYLAIPNEGEPTDQVATLLQTLEQWSDI